MSRKISISEAQERFVEITQLIKHGEAVVLTEDNEIVARIVPAKQCEECTINADLWEGEKVMSATSCEGWE